MRYSDRSVGKPSTALATQPVHIKGDCMQPRVGMGAFKDRAYEAVKEEHEGKAQAHGHDVGRKCERDWDQSQAQSRTRLAGAA